MGSQHVFRGWFPPLDLPYWVLESGSLLARPARQSILTDRGLAEFDAAIVWVDISVDVGDTHCGG